MIFVADGGSTDDTREVAREIDIDSFKVEKIVSIYRGVPGKGSALRAIFEAADFLDAKAVALFDADLRSITPEWVKNMIEPIMQGYEYVAPWYRGRSDKKLSERGCPGERHCQIRHRYLADYHRYC
ncbi:MAG: glycosyltransferase [Campylobacterota bacterium]|nr:glycosyltransferase [Campylobacterota bacterium]